jgi:hypothetical protein
MINLDSITLSDGAHSKREDGLCLMEAVAYFANEPHSDSPACASPVLTRFGIRLNDRFRDDERQLLKPLIPRLIGTRTTAEHDQRRAFVLVDAAVREIVPLALEIRWPDLAEKLRTIAPIVDRASADAARPVAREVRGECYRRRAAYAYADAAAAAADAAYAYAYAAATDAATRAATDAATDDATHAATHAATYAATHAATSAAYAADAAAAARPKIVNASIAAFSRAIDVPTQAS